MNRTDRFDDVVSDWLHADAEHRVPEHLDAVLRRTSSERQRPAWSSLERWLPVQTTLRFAPAPRIAWLLVILALVIALATTILVVGSRRQAAPPFGLARNGPVAFSKGGDIYRFDPATGTTTALVTGVEHDIAPYFAPDGQHLVFLRQAEGRDVVAIADADGRNVRTLTAPLTGQRWWDWSRDSARLAIVSEIDGKHAISVANIDGSGSQVVPLDMEADFVAWLGLAGERLLFRGYPLTGTSGLFTVKPDGSDLVQVSPDLGDALGDYQFPSITSDGLQVVYSAFDQGTWHSPTAGSPAEGVTGGILRVHVLDLVTGQDRAIPIAADPTAPTLPVDEWNPRLSPDGTMLAFQVDRSDGTYQVAVAHADGSDIPRTLGPSAKDADGESGPSYEFSPDGTKLIARYPGLGTVWALPVDGSAGSTLPWDDVDLPSMQRLAP